MYSVAPTNVYCPCCGSRSSVLGEAHANPKRALHHCQCSACLLCFDRIVALNGKGMTVLYAVPTSSGRTRARVRVVPDPGQEGAHAS